MNTNTNTTLTPILTTAAPARPRPNGADGGPPTAHQATHVDPARRTDVTGRPVVDADTFRSSNLVKFVVRRISESTAANDAELAVINSKSAKAGAAAAKVSRKQLREAKVRVMINAALSRPEFLWKSFHEKVESEKNRRANVWRIRRQEGPRWRERFSVTADADLIARLDAVHPKAYHLHLILTEWSNGRARIQFTLDNRMLARLIGPPQTVAAILEGLARIEQIVLVTPVTSGWVTVDPCHPSSLYPEVLAEVEKLEREAQLAKEGADVQAC